MRTTPPAAAAVVTSAVLVAGCTTGAGAAADGGPTGNVTMVVPFNAGGGSDLAGRAMAAGLEGVTGHTTTVSNIVGGSGAVGYAELLTRRGDASVLLASETALMTLPVVQDVPFTYDSFTPIMKMGEDYNVVLVAAGSPEATCTDVVDRARGERVTTAVSGATGPDNIAWTLIEQEEGIELQRVTFESSAEVLAALLGGQVDVVAASPGEVLGQIESGDVRALCALAPDRYEYDLLADVPTGGEQGIDVTFAQWRGLIAPAGVSDLTRQYWVDAARAFAGTAAYEEYIESNLLQPTSLFDEEFAAYLDDYDADVREALQP